MRSFSLIISTVSILSVLVACDGPSPRMIGSLGNTVVVGGSVFEVYVKGNVAEAVRTNFEFPAKIDTIFPRARIAIEQVSGCSIQENGLFGDAALIRAKLDCGPE